MRLYTDSIPVENTPEAIDAFESCGLRPLSVWVSLEAARQEVSRLEALGKDGVRYSIRHAKFKDSVATLSGSFADDAEAEDE
jgi:hypothetical protein